MQFRPYIAAGKDLLLFYISFFTNALHEMNNEINIVIIITMIPVKIFIFSFCKVDTILPVNTSVELAYDI